MTIALRYAVPRPLHFTSLTRTRGLSLRLLGGGDIDSAMGSNTARDDVASDGSSASCISMATYEVVKRHAARDDTHILKPAEIKAMIHWCSRALVGATHRDLLRRGIVDEDAGRTQSGRESSNIDLHRSHNDNPADTPGRTYRYTVFNSAMWRCSVSNGVGTEGYESPHLATASRTFHPPLDVINGSDLLGHPNDIQSLPLARYIPVDVGTLAVNICRRAHETDPQRALVESPELLSIRRDDLSFWYGQLTGTVPVAIDASGHFEWGSVQNFIAREKYWVFQGHPRSNVLAGSVEQALKALEPVRDAARSAEPSIAYCAESTPRYTESHLQALLEYAQSTLPHLQGACPNFEAIFVVLVPREPHNRTWQDFNADTFVDYTASRISFSHMRYDDVRRALALYGVIPGSVMSAAVVASGSVPVISATQGSLLG